jgi:hypothetical protein
MQQGACAHRHDLARLHAGAAPELRRSRPDRKHDKQATESGRYDRDPRLGFFDAQRVQLRHRDTGEVTAKRAAPGNQKFDTSFGMQCSLKLNRHLEHFDAAAAISVPGRRL